MERSRNENTGTPLSGIKRRIDYDQENVSQTEHKKLNMSQDDAAAGKNLIGKTESFILKSFKLIELTLISDRHVLEAQVKEYQAKLSLLEHQIKSLEVDNKAQKSELNSEREKIRAELIVRFERAFVIIKLTLI
jgi:hypothetical protein